MKNRIKKVLKLIEKKGLDALLISDPYNIKYLTGFRIAEGYLILSREKLVYVTNFIYQKEAEKNKSWKVIVAEDNIFQKTAQEVKRQKIRNIGFEAKKLSFLEYRYIKKELSSRDINLLKTVDLVERVRAVKEVRELNCLRKAIEITLCAFDFVREIVDERWSEKQLCLEIERFLKLKGDLQIGFPPIVAFGENTSFPHHRPSEQKWSRDKISLIDLGARAYGYCADLTRVLFLDKMPHYLEKIYTLVKKAQELAIKKIRSGVKAKEVDKTAREYIEKKGFEKFFGHGLGHGVGLCVHEKPFLNPRSEDILEENMVVTVEPAIYLPAKFGIRLESMVLVKKDRGEVLDGYLCS